MLLPYLDPLSLRSTAGTVDGTRDESLTFQLYNTITVMRISNVWEGNGLFLKGRESCPFQGRLLPEGQ